MSRRRCSGRLWAAGRRRRLRLLNPIAADLDQMRPTPVATLALAAQRNVARGAPDGALFEIGPGFDVASQQVVAAGLRYGAPPRIGAARRRRRMRWR